MIQFASKYRPSALLFVLVICVIWINANAAYAEEKSSEEAYSVSITGQYRNFNVCECILYIDLANPWGSFWNCDPVSLKYLRPLSIKPIRDQGEMMCTGVDPAEMAAFSMSSVVARHPAAKTRCPFPLFPRDPMYYGKFSSGVEVFIRLQSDKPVDVINARISAEVITLNEVSPAFVALRMSDGQPLESDPTDTLPEVLFSIQECENLRSLETKTNQLAAMKSSAELIVRLLSLYRERNGQYPMKLCGLSLSGNAIIGGYLTNPFRADTPLCVIDRSKPLPKYILDYIPELSSDEEGKSQVVGYWLLISGEGHEVSPTKALPNTKPFPSNAIMWFEEHPES